MPSRLVTSALNQLTASGRARATLKSAVAQVTTGVQTVEVRGPFLGFQPDIDANLTDGTAFEAMTNVLARAYEDGELLGLPDGYRQVDPTRLPLGDGSTLPASPVTDADPVVRLDQLSRVTPSGTTGTGDLSLEWVLTPMAVTAGNGTTGAGTAGSGNMYRISAAGSWTFVAGAASMAATTRQLSAGRDGRSINSPSLPDSCIAPFGCPVATRPSNTGGADDRQSGAINEPCWIYCNDVDEVMVFPSSSALTIAGTHDYEPLVDHITSVDLDSGGANGFKAKSCETWNGRVYFLNTSEAGTRRQQRLRRTAKFTAHPNTAIVGSGFYDFRDFQGEGLRVETLGDVLAVYFSDGVAFVRPTGVPTSPDEPQIISTERGLLSTHGVCPIGRNVHFGIFSDGWWLLDQSGRWQELGVVNINDKVVPKWRQTFYGDIPANMRHRIYTYYDQPNNLIYIVKPTTESPDPTEVWIYDPTSDRVFIENYPITVMGSFTPLTSAAIAIDALPGTIDSLTGTIDSFAGVVGFPKARIHGDAAGFVYSHKRGVVGFHGQQRADIPTVQSPSWSMSVGLRSPAGFRNLVTVDRVSVEYFNRENPANVSITVAGPTADGAQSRSVLLNATNLGDLRHRDAWFRYSSQAPGLTLSGVGEFQIRATSVDLWADPIEPRGL